MIFRVKLIRHENVKKSKKVVKKIYRGQAKESEFLERLL